MGQGLILKPLISEKSLGLANQQEYTFMVKRKSKKGEIAKTIKEVFGVDVEKVKTMVVKGKTRRAFRTRKEKHLSAWKKAIVRIKKGQKIDVFEIGSQPVAKALSDKEEKK